MKSPFVYFLLTIYTIANFGILINMHYCSDELAGVKINSIGKSACECEPSDEDAGCCHEEVSLVKLKEVHQSQISEKLTFEKIALPLFYYSFFVNPNLSLVNKQASYSPSKPPNIAGNKIYRAINVFLI